MLGGDEVEVVRMPVGYEKSMAIVDEFVPVQPEQASQCVGKLLCWGNIRGTWHGVISSNGYRWTFGITGILGKPEELVEGQQVSFRSRFKEDFQGLGAADMVKPYSGSDPNPNPTSQPKLNDADVLRTFTNLALQQPQSAKTEMKRPLPEPVRLLLEPSPLPEPRIPLPQPEEECYGRVIFYGVESREGCIEVDSQTRFKFTIQDVVRGDPSADADAMAKFRVRDGRAVAVEIV